MLGSALQTDSQGKTGSMLKSAYDTHAQRVPSLVDVDLLPILGNSSEFGNRLARRGHLCRPSRRCRWRFSGRQPPRPDRARNATTPIGLSVALTVADDLRRLQPHHAIRPWLAPIAEKTCNRGGDTAQKMQESRLQWGGSQHDVGRVFTRSARLWPARQ